MKPGGAKVVLASFLGLLGFVGACTGQTMQRGGSETNWLAICSTDADCIVGQCLCGVCSATCDDATSCPAGGGLDVCAVKGSPEVGKLCVATQLPPKGVCLRGCGTGAACTSGFSCMNGTCLPDRHVSTDAGTDAVAPTKGPLGAFCPPGDERNANFPGYAETEVNIEDHGSPSCLSGVCLVVGFRGRTTCPYGQPADPSNPKVADPAFQNCVTTGPNPVPVTVPVPAQLVSRPPEISTYCSCRCDGPPGEGPFCTCPSGFDCKALVDYAGTSSSIDASGAYCLKSGTLVPDPMSLHDAPVCNRAAVAPRPTGCGDP